MATPGASGILTHEQEILARCAWTGIVERQAGERNTQAMRAERDRALEQVERRGARALRLRAERDEARAELEEERAKVARLRRVLERRIRELRESEGRMRERMYKLSFIPSYTEGC